MMFPKNPPGRNQRYRDMARGRDCVLRVPEVCCGDPNTVVLAHSNRGADGKGGAMKACDAAAVFACVTCHAWLDTDRDATAEEKDAAFDRGLRHQRVLLERIANNPMAKQRDIATAAWAMQRLPARAFD